MTEMFGFSKQRNSSGEGRDGAKAIAEEKKIALFDLLRFRAIPITASILLAILVYIALAKQQVRFPIIFSLLSAGSLYLTLFSTLNKKSESKNKKAFGKNNQSQVRGMLSKSWKGAPVFLFSAALLVFLISSIVTSVSTTEGEFLHEFQNWLIVLMLISGFLVLVEEVLTKRNG
ncbi:MAG: hypothetical protein PHP64_06345 [Actinomycetota bacterium]|nr:hypothetical protein [Actinomycetota bacterium]